MALSAARILALALSAAAVPAIAAPAAQAPNWAKGAPVAITVTNDRFIPERIVLRSGRTYILRFHNPSDRSHSFSARTFFKIARVDPRDQALVRDNKVELAPGQRAALHVVAPTTPNAVYEFRNLQLADAGERMKGTILVR